MKNIYLTTGFFACLMASTLSAQNSPTSPKVVTGQSQTQTQTQAGQKQTQTQTQGSQLSQQNNGQTHQTAYQVNGSKGAGQGQGAGTNKAQADYNASAALRKSPVSPQGSVQHQEQTQNGITGTQKSTTKPPQSTSKGSVSPQ